MALKTDFKDDIFEGNRKYKLSQDDAGNTEIQDVTVYSQEGDLFTAEHINATNTAVNGLSKDMADLKKSVSDGKTQVAAAITAKRVPTAATATFGEMAANIGKIVLGSGNAVPSDVLAGKTFTNNDGREYTGTMPNRGDYWGWGNSKGNDAGSQRMWVKIPQGYYNENANVLLSWADIRAMAGITPEKVKKNEWILGIQGNFEGWVPNPQDLYYNGANSGGLTVNPSLGWNFENTRIHYAYTGQNGNTAAFTFGRWIDVKSYSKLILEGFFKFTDGLGNLKETNAILYTNAVPGTISSVSAKGPLYSIEFDITQVAAINAGGHVDIASGKSEQWITRIRLA